MLKLQEDFPSKISPKYSFSSPFSLIRSPFEFSSFFPCQHDSFIPHNPQTDYGNCKDCGVYLNKVSNVFGLKTKKNSFKLDISSRPLMENFQNTMISQVKSLNQASNYAKNRSSLIDWLFEMAKKLDLSLNSAHLAIVYLDIIMSREKEELTPIHLFSTTCLLLAAKAIELDERIPFLPKLRKMAAPMYKNEDFKKAEREILSALDWRLQIPTFFDFMEYYISQGIIFTSDQINGEDIQQSSMTPSPDGGHLAYKEQKFASPFLNNERSRSFIANSSGSTGIQFYGKISNEKKIYELISTIEKDIVRLAGYIAKDICLYEWDIRIMAAAGVAFLRKVNNITPIWNKELENISLGVKQEDFEAVFDTFVIQYGASFETYIFQQSRQESNLMREFSNMRLNKENTTIPTALALKKAHTSEETNKSFEAPGGFSGYLRAYTLGLENDALNFPRSNPGMNRLNESKKLYNPGIQMNKNYSHNLVGVNHLSRNPEEYLQNPYILKDAENKMNIYNNNNNGFKSYFQERNTNSLTDIGSLNRKIDEFYGKIFNNHPISKKI